MAKSPHTPEWRAMVAEEYLAGNTSAHKLAIKYNISQAVVLIWAKKFKEQGIYGFINTGGNKKYTADFKIYCVELFISGKMSAEEIVAKYNISHYSVLSQWISKYNSNIELKDYDPKREVYMASARRKTTIEERQEIVKYCIDNNRDYKGTAEKYDVSYAQVYEWVKKYTENGEEGLKDKRGKHKTDEEVDELERLRRENLRLKRQLQEKDNLVELLKKVKEFERM